MTLLHRLICCVAAIAIAACPDMSAATPKKKAAPRTADKVKKEQTTTQRKISETSRQIDNTNKQLRRQLNSLNSLNADIRQQDLIVGQLRNHIDSLGNAINSTTDSIAILEKNLDDMRKSYAKALRKLQPSVNEMSALSFIFSAGSFSEAYSRLRYLNRFNHWRQHKAAEIEDAIDNISRHRQQLTGLRHSQDKAYRRAADARRTLAVKQGESEKLVTSLRKQDSQLRSELAKQKKQARALDRELDRIIAAEQERIAREERARQAKAKKSTDTKGNNSKSTDGGKSTSQSARDIASSKAQTQTAASTSASQLTGSFAANKGRLLFPVSGKYKIVRNFGRQPHPTQKHVVTDNSGIDVEVPSGTSARAVFDGTVSAIFRQDGFHTIVMLRHGKYLTIYAGLSDTSVSQGQKVKAGQTLGRIYSDPSDSNRSILHFEVRDERSKLNPTLWVK